MSGRNNDEIEKMLMEARGRVEVGARYRHFKGGEYVVRDIVVIEAEECAGVVYESLATGVRWVRTVENFCEEVAGGARRFEKVKGGE